MLHALKQMHVLLMFIGGIVLVALVAPWYYRSERLTPSRSWSMSAFGGSLERVSAQSVKIYLFNPLPSYLTLCFATISILFPFVSTKLPEKSQRKYVAIVSCLTGICALMTLVYIHSWLSLVLPETPFVCEGLIYLDCGPMIGYFLTWVAAALLFASTYVSQGLNLKPESKGWQKNSSPQHMYLPLQTDHTVDSRANLSLY